MNPTRFDPRVHGRCSALTDDDRIFFFGEYNIGAGFRGSTNDLIHNLKKSPSRRGLPEWRWKERAIAEAGKLLADGLPDEVLQDWTFVPVPPSRAKDDAEYDDRLLRVLQAAGVKDLRELVTQKTSIRTAHGNAGNRPTAVELEANYDVNRAIQMPVPTRIVIFDDVLTQGAHYRAMANRIDRVFPKVPKCGLFIARSI